ncbi:hypothetical protein AMR42_15255 [Limnothrix sp. PR1529]|nr:hypothetical protein BCR12_06720 [Limnothrix sp. P13C2]PIB06010.1 hypothetical protein AMR42_15255 [Limnothrix sp. PR1529]
MPDDGDGSSRNREIVKNRLKAKALGVLGARDLGSVVKSPETPILPLADRGGKGLKPPVFVG